MADSRGSDSSKSLPKKMCVGECGPASPPRGGDQNGHRHNSTIPCVHVKVESKKNVPHTFVIEAVHSPISHEHMVMSCVRSSRNHVKTHEKRNRGSCCRGSCENWRQRQIASTRRCPTGRRCRRYAPGRCLPGRCWAQCGLIPSSVRSCRHRARRFESFPE